MDLQTILHYSDKARSLLRETLADNESLLDRPFGTTSQYTSIRKLMAHIIGAEERWLARIEQREVPARYEELMGKTPGELWDDWDRVRAGTRQCLLTGDLSRSLRVELPMWQHEGDATVEQILFHVFNHETHHRAQISMLLQHFGVDPPNFDFVLLMPFS